MWILALAWGASPEVEVSWRGDAGWVTVRPPAGSEISAEAPVDLELTRAGQQLRIEADGAALAEGLAVGPLRGRSVEGAVHLQLCAKATGVCTPTSLAVQGQIPGTRRGARVLSPPASTAPERLFNADASEVADRAYAAAQTSGELVLLDFSAVWCPPCNLLAAEVLHAPDAGQLLAGFQVAVLDVDHRSSWALKDRYAVGGYPTVVVTDAAGTELARLVGYEDKASFLQFLGASRRPQPTDPGGLTPDQAARALWGRVQADRGEDLGPWVQAAAGSDLPEAHLARFRIEPSEAEARWLIERAPGTALRWVPWAGQLGDSASGRALLLEAVRAGLARAEGTQGAELLSLAAGLAPEADRPLLAASAAAALRAGFTGDDLRDRAWWTTYASLLDDAGTPDLAVRFLDQRAAAYPDEPTFLLSAAALLNRRGRHAEALERAVAATPLAWGDNALRVAAVRCEALVGLGREDEARALAQQVLADDDAPEAGVEVRTHRYRARLEAYLAK